MIKNFITGLILFVGYFAIYSCKEDDSAFTIGDNLVDVKSDVIIVDNTTINSYTVKSDSIITSGYTKSLVGRYTDGSLGTITSSSFFQVSTNVNDIETNSKYDSICLILNPTGYCYGDSTKQFTLEVRKLKESLDNSEITYRYNTSKVKYDHDNLLGSIKAVIKPGLKKVLNVRLSDAFGSVLFDSILNKRDVIKKQTEFVKYLKGIALVTDTLSETSSIMQFDATDTATSLRVYYTVQGVDKYLDFKINNTSDFHLASLQFNHIQGNYLGTPLYEHLKGREDVLLSTQTSNETYCQAGTGLMTKIEFPNLKSIFEAYTTYKILKARLIIPPVKNSYKVVPLPRDLTLYFTNSINAVGNNITTSENKAIAPDIKADVEDQPYYEFDLTSFLTYIMQNHTDEIPALLLTKPLDNNGNSFERLVLGDYYREKNAMKLEITFWKY